MSTQQGTFQRKVCSLLADFRRTRKTWTELSDIGFTLSNSLVNARLQQRYIDHRSFWHSAFDEFKDLKSQYENKVGTVIKEYSSKLNDIVEKLAAQQSKMNTYVTQLQVLTAQAQQNFGYEFVSKRPLYLTCPLATFVNLTEKIFHMYSAEMKLKRNLAQTFLTVTEREQAMVMLTAWLNQPNIDDDAVCNFEELCEVEMGERYLK